MSKSSRGTKDDDIIDKPPQKMCKPIVVSSISIAGESGDMSFGFYIAISTRLAIIYSRNDQLNGMIK
jgi:hypothetical protein